MLSASLQEERLQTIREFVREELCVKNQLEKNAFQMTERVLVKKGQPCGFFLLHLWPAQCAADGSVGFAARLGVLLRFTGSAIGQFPVTCRRLLASKLV